MARSNRITLRGDAANTFLAQMHRDEDLANAFANSCGPARKAVVAEIVRRGVKVPGVCVKCGCTEDDCSQCIARTGLPCSWTDETRTLCDACQTAVRPALVLAAEQMDWVQLALNGGPPCFHLCEDGHFCGRAERWEGHGELHKFVPLADLLAPLLDVTRSLVEVIRKCP